LRPQLHYLSGLVLLDTGRPAAALAAFRRCTYLDPGFVLGHLGQAGLLANGGQRRRAGAALDRAAALIADLDPDAPVLDAPVLDSPGLNDAGPRVAEVRELIATQWRLLEPETGGG
jgi:hypothetical protein